MPLGLTIGFLIGRGMAVVGLLGLSGGNDFDGLGQSPKVMVSTDILHAVVVNGVTSLLHFSLGNVNLSLVT